MEIPKNQPELLNTSEQKRTDVNSTEAEEIIAEIKDKELEEKRRQAETQDNNRIQELREEHGFEQPKMPEPKIGKLKTKAYAEENLGEFENVEIKKVSELSCWNKINDFIASKKIVGIDNIETIIASGGKHWESIFGSNDSKSSHDPMTIILKKEIFDNENISDEDASWLVHEIGHIKFYQDLGNKLDEYTEEYHKRGEYTDSDMEKVAFELQFEYLKSTGKTKDECDEVVKKYLDKSFGDNKIEEAEKEAKAKEYKQIMKFLDNVYEVNTGVPRTAENLNRDEEMKKILAERRLEIDKIADANGKGIEEKIKDVIIALNIAGFPTSQSCQGHYGEDPEIFGMGAPWISIGASDEPEERFNNQNAIFQRVAEKYKMPIDELKRSFNPDAYWESMKEASEQGETAEYQEWDKKNQELFKRAQNLLDEFYKDRKVDDSLKLQLEEGVSGFRIHNGGEDYKDSEDNIPKEEKEAHKKRLELYQGEMKEFSEFLLNKFHINNKI